MKVTFTSEDVLHSTVHSRRSASRPTRFPGATARSGSRRRRSGEFHLFCAEYCGTNHSGMIGTVVVMEPADYQAWLSGSAAAARWPRAASSSSAARLRHLPPQRWTGRGPSLASKFGAQVKLASGATVAVDDGYIRESILTPQAKLVAGYQPLMPTFQGLVNEEGVMSLIEYIKSLPPGARGVERGSAEARGADGAQENR